MISDKSTVRFVHRSGKSFPFLVFKINVQKQRERTQIANTKNERGDIIIDHIDINKIIMEYCEQLHEHKLDNIDEISHSLKYTIYQNSYKMK